jgi:27-O-demethylrifamycin SV methyltransferase
LHYGVFAGGDEALVEATAALTKRMAEACQLAEGLEVLDVGCGTGAPACAIAVNYGLAVLGITTSAVGVHAATERAAAAGVPDRVRFEVRDGMENGLPDASFDRVWVLESSHLMPERARLLAECARVLRAGGRLALCDITRQRAIPFLEVRSKLRDFSLLRAVFGEARMEPLEVYRQLAEDAGLVVDEAVDLTILTRPTFERWRANAAANRSAVAALLGDDDYDAFVESTKVLEGFWDDGTLGYGLIAAAKPS